MRSTSYYLLLFILPLANCGCKKNASQGSGSLSGTWELRETSAAMNPVLSRFEAGNGNKIAFGNTGYKIFKDGLVVKSGQFNVVQDTTVEASVCILVPDGKFTNRVVYADSTMAKIFYQVEGNKLTFLTGCYAYDAGHSEVYERVSESGE
jgi:hypothetical protein